MEPLWAIRECRRLGSDFPRLKFYFERTRRWPGVFQGDGLAIEALVRPCARLEFVCTEKLQRVRIISTRYQFGGSSSEVKGITSLRGIANELNKRGIATARGGQWSACTPPSLSQSQHEGRGASRNKRVGGLAARAAALSRRTSNFPSFMNRLIIGRVW
jgi:hypothetical protein